MSKLSNERVAVLLAEGPYPLERCTTGGFSHFACHRSPVAITCYFSVHSVSHGSLLDSVALRCKHCLEPPNDTRWRRITDEREVQTILSRAALLRAGA